MKEYHIYLRNMLSFAEEATAIACANGNDRLRLLSLERLFVMLAEAAKNIPREVRDAHLHISWKSVIDLRNNVAHGYDGHTLSELEEMAKHEVDELATTLRKILPELED